MLVLPKGGQKDRLAMRSDCHTQQSDPQAKVPSGFTECVTSTLRLKNGLVFLTTNNFLLPPLTITQLDQCRWQVKLFFRWIKQHLRIKAFYGTSENAVQTIYESFVKWIIHSLIFLRCFRYTFTPRP
jgi:IS4 transposase